MFIASNDPHFALWHINDLGILRKWLFAAVACLCVCRCRLVWMAE